MTYSPKHRANVVRPNGLDPRNKADCDCERIAVRKLRGVFCPRHESIEYSTYNAEHRGGRHAANSRQESAYRSEADCVPEVCYDIEDGAERHCPRHDPAIYAERFARHSIESDGGFW